MKTKLPRFFQWLKAEHAATIDNVSVLEEISMDDEDFTRELLQTAADSIRQYEAALTEGFTANERPFYLAVHSLKATVRNLGMNGIGDFYQRLEEKLTNHAQPTSQEINELLNKTGQVRAIVHEMIGYLN